MKHFFFANYFLFLTPKQKKITEKYLIEHKTDYDVSFRVVLLGDSFVGKTMFVLRTDGLFSDSYVETIGVDFVFF